MFKNLNGTPASNFPTFRFVSSLGGFSLAGGSSTNGDARKTSADSGATWAGTANSVIGGFRLGFSDATSGGFPVSNFAIAGAGVGIYSTRELGAVFPSPAVGVRAIGLFALANAKTGTPTGNMRLRLYTGASPPLIDTTDAVGNSPLVTNVALISGYFSTAQVISASSTVRVTVGETAQSDASTNRYNLSAFAVDTDAPSLELMPQGSFQRTYFDGTSWTDAPGEVVPCGLILDPGDEFVTTAPTGGGIKLVGSGGLAG